jgi:hypothetical protein
MPYSTTTEFLQSSLHLFPETSKRVLIVKDKPHFRKDHGIDILVGFVCEPEAFMKARHAFIKNHMNFDLLLTHDEEILKACPNARLCLYGTTWISKSVYEHIDVSRKQPKISCVTGSKEFTPAHTYRKLLYANQLNIPLPIRWFRSCYGDLLPAYQHNPIVPSDPDGKVGLFLDFQFSLVIENSRQTHYFTEKLMDCLLTKTIPIYYGCPNIAEYFDTRGWILLETTDMNELIAKASVLPNYEDFAEVIEHNHREAAMKYTSLAVNIQRAMNLGV